MSAQQALLPTEQALYVVPDKSFWIFCGWLVSSRDGLLLVTQAYLPCSLLELQPHECQD